MNKTDKVKDLKGEIWKRYEDTDYYGGSDAAG